MSSEKTQAEILKEKLFSKNKNAYDVMSDAEVKQAFDFCEGYKTFLNEGKTERKATEFAVNAAKENGFSAFDYKKEYKAGDKIYLVNRDKSVMLAVIGTDSFEEGFHIAAAHIDCPRLDLKPNPIYEDGELAFFKTHYYGGIKKYQWTALPLSLHGVIVKKDGSKVNVSIGEEENEPVFTVTDLLPHLAKDQMAKTLDNAISGEALNVVIGSIPFKDDKASERIKLNILNLFFEKYGVTEEDFVSAELEVVPAYKASDVGFDRSLVGGYGQDDRVCSYTALMAILESKAPQKTAIVILADKEEIGSVGNTGLNADYFKSFAKMLCKASNSNYLVALQNSKCLSADVSAAFDANYPEVNEKNNTAFMNHGTALIKYNGARGKSGTSDASAELIGYFRKLFDDHHIVWQTGELGKVDQGGGGTVAMFLAHLEIDVVDLGVPVLSMHSPFEVTAKADIFMTYKAISAFFK